MGSIDYTKSRKRVHAFAGELRRAARRCASWEVDRAEFVPLEDARELLHPDQQPFLSIELSEAAALKPREAKSRVTFSCFVAQPAHFDLAQAPPWC